MAADRAPCGRPPREVETMQRSNDPAWFRRVLGSYPTGVCVITASQADGRPVGLTVGSFTSVSLVPALIGFFPDKSSTSWPKIRTVGRFCVNILGTHQQDVCRQLASKAEDKFKGLSHRSAPSGAPILDDVVGWIDCELADEHEVGDHYAVFGKVLDLDLATQNHPLIFLKGGYGAFAPIADGGSASVLNSDQTGRKR
jgi:flavin reductase (DIM6/NTAB) family NADH-FMN oxidoreductase RutF